MCSGSAQIVLEHGGERVVVSGDYKRRPDPTCAPFVAGAVRHLHHRGDLRPAGLPPSRRPAARSTGCCIACTPIPSAACWSAPMRWARRSGSSPNCAAAGHDDPIYYSRRDRAAVRALRRASASQLGELRPATGATEGGDGGPDRHRARLGALNDRWSRRLPDPITAMASGWMRDPPARAAAQCRAAADRLRSCRLGRTDRDDPGARAHAKCGSPTAARKR